MWTTQNDSTAIPASVQTGLESPNGNGDLPQGEAKANILLVDDRQDKLLALESVIAHLGENIVKAHSGKEALRRLLHQDFAVILLDINMPGMDGFETAALIRQRKQSEHTPIIFVTGVSDTETHVSRGYSLGAVDYILTPVLPDVLRTKVSVFVELHKKARQIQLQADSLRRAHDELETRVQERTAELASANESLNAEIAERKRAEARIRSALQEKEVLLKEIHHRVKNNLQIISSLLNLQAAEIEDPETAARFQESQERVRTMALIHEQLYRAGNLAEVDFAEYLRELVPHLARSYSACAAAVELKIEAAKVLLPVDVAIPCGLIVNELIANALKHGFPNGRKGSIQVCLSEKDRDTTLQVRDNGIGFPAAVDFRQSRSLGLQLVCTLTSQLRGTIDLKREGGTEFVVSFQAAHVGGAVTS
jgi:two-component sensor histidine kinase/DNA-binding NarL/FixJ family response regulator